MPIGLPKLDTKWIMARRNVLCSGVEISVMKAAIPILRLECGKFSQSTHDGREYLGANLYVMYPPERATGRLTEKRRNSLGQDMK